MCRVELKERVCPELQLLVAESCCALGLQHMHAHVLSLGYCHSDVKPENILLFDSGGWDSLRSDLSAKIADLDMAALCDRATGRVVPGQFFG